MLNKMDLDQFKSQATQDQQEFEAIEQEFANHPSLVKLTRNEKNGRAYSYIWYQNSDTDKKTVIRMANKNVTGHVLGAGTYGRAKYGVDKHGRLYAVKIQHEYVHSFLLGQQTINNRYPGNFTVTDSKLYFQSGKTHVEIPEPINDPALHTLYISIKNKIKKSSVTGYSASNLTDTATLIRLLVASHIDLSSDPLNISQTPVKESTISKEVGLAFADRVQRETTVFTLNVVVSYNNLMNSNLELSYGQLYTYLYADGFIGYTMLDASGVIQHTKTNIRLSPDILKTHDYDNIFNAITAKKSEIMAYARTKTHVPYKDDPNPIALTGDKSYQVLQLGETTLEAALEQPLDLSKKLSITRRLLWECSKLHSGKLSSKGHAYIHCDLKPSNILVNSDSVKLIDYGLSVSADTKSTLHGTAWYVPVVGGKDPINPGEASFDTGYANRVKGLKTGFDVFSLKRIIRMPAHDGVDNRCIFQDLEWNALPIDLKKNISIGEDQTSTVQAVNFIRDNKETALDLAMRFIAMEAVPLKDSRIDTSKQYNEYMDNLKSLSVEQQERVCECAELIDLMQSHEPRQPLYSVNTIIDAVKKVSNRSDPIPILALKTALLNESCLSLLDQNEREAWRNELTELDNILGDQPFEMHAYLNDLFQKIQTSVQAPDKTTNLRGVFLSLQNKLMEYTSDLNPSLDNTSHASSSSSNHSSPMNPLFNTSGFFKHPKSDQKDSKDSPLTRPGK